MLFINFLTIFVYFRFVKSCFTYLRFFIFFYLSVNALQNLFLSSARFSSLFFLFLQMPQSLNNPCYVIHNMCNAILPVPRSFHKYLLLWNACILKSPLFISILSVSMQFHFLYQIPWDTWSQGILPADFSGGKDFVLMPRSRFLRSAPFHVQVFFDQFHTVIPSDFGTVKHQIVI